MRNITLIPITLADLTSGFNMILHYVFLCLWISKTVCESCLGGILSQ